MEDRKDTHVKLGWYVPRDIAEAFREGCVQRGYNQSALIRIAMESKISEWREEDAQGDAA